MTEAAPLERARRLQGLIGSILNTVLGGGGDGGNTETAAPEPAIAPAPAPVVAPVVAPSPAVVAPTPTTEAPAHATRAPTPTTRTPAPTTRKPVTRTPEPTTEEPTTPSPTPSSTPEATPEPESVISSSGSTETEAPETPVPTIEANDTNDNSLSLSSSADSELTTTDSLSGSIDTGIGGWSSGSYGSLNSHGLAASQDAEGQSSSQGVNTWMVAAIVLASVAAVLIIVGLVALRRKRSDSKELGDSLSPPFQRHINKNPKVNMSVDTVNSRLDTSSTGPFTGHHERELGGNPTSLLAAAPGDMWEDDTITAMRIPIEKIRRGKLLNRGGYGMVYHGSYRGEPVAIKTLLPEQRKTLRQINAFLAEIKLMAAMDHPRIVRLIGVAWDSLVDLCCVAEYMDGGDLRSFLNHAEYEEHRPHGFDYDKARIALHVAHSLTYLHSLDPQVLHRDLKSKNILLTSSLEAKITDFGVSRESSDQTMTAGVGTCLWMAPEVMMGERYGPSADIFSFGVVLSELDSHLLPYAATKETDSGRLIPDTALLQLVSVGLLRIEFSPHAPQELVELAHACVDLDPEARPTAGEVLYKVQLIMNKYESATF